GGDTAFEPRQDITLEPTVSISEVLAAALDGDGKLDLVGSDRVNSRIWILSNTSTAIGDIQFTTTHISVGNAPRDLTVGDIDGDGRPDLVVSSTGSNKVSILQNTSIAGLISFDAPLDITTPSSVGDVMLQDINRDGKPELMIVMSDDHYVSVYPNTSTPGSMGFGASQNYTSGEDPRSMAIGDLDNDGLLDLALANSTGNTISIFRNLSTPGGAIDFDDAMNVANGTAATDISIADLNGDGQ